MYVTGQQDHVVLEDEVASCGSMKAENGTVAILHTALPQQHRLCLVSTEADHAANEHAHGKTKCFRQNAKFPTITITLCHSFSHCWDS